MTTEQILQKIKRRIRTLIYFGDNIAQFQEVAEAIYPDYADRLMEQISEYNDGTEFQLVLRTFHGRFDGWNVEDSLECYRIHLERDTCAHRYGAFINATKVKRAVIL